MNARSRRVEICGGIASGKSTLATLCTALPASPCFEAFEANPFYELFYHSPEKYAFETEVTFLLQHLGAVKQSSETQTLSVCDFSFALDLAFAQTTLRGRPLETFHTVLTECLSAISPPDLIIHLIGEPSHQITRIRQRGRLAEQTIGLGYITALNQNIEVALQSQEFRHVPRLRLDSDQIDLNDRPSTLDVIRENIP